MNLSGNTFLLALKEEGGDYRLLWTTKRHPNDEHDNVAYLNLYGRPVGVHGQPDNEGSRPDRGSCILNDFGKDGYEVFYPSPRTTVSGDVYDVLRGAA